MKNFKTLEVGKTYKAKNGELVKIQSESDSLTYPFNGNNNCSYVENGRLLLNREDDRDLIELIEDKHLTIEEIDAEIKKLQELRKELDKSVEVDEYWLNTIVVVRGDGEYERKGFYLNSKWNWEIIKDSKGELVLVPTIK